MSGRADGRWKGGGRRSLKVGGFLVVELRYLGTIAKIPFSTPTCRCFPTEICMKTGIR